MRDGIGIMIWAGIFFNSNFNKMELNLMGNGNKIELVVKVNFGM